MQNFPYNRLDFFKLKYYLKIFIIIFEYNKLLNKSVEII